MTSTVLARPARNEERQRRPSLTRSLGVVGWRHLDPVLLAFLASEQPLLLVGEHGTAKSFLVRRLAAALGKVARVYDASQIQIDDLCGLFYPDPEGSGLRFVATEAAIWDAEIVLLDELSRARPDLANRLFSIIHDKEILGHKLEKLIWRVAAMNPPPVDEEEGYLGTQPLDDALADRFVFVVRVPSWRDFSEHEVNRLVRQEGAADRENGFDLTAAVERTGTVAQGLSDELRGLIAEYVLHLGRRLEQAKIQISGRRLVMLGEAIRYVHAARAVLQDVDVEEVSLGTSALLALENGLPHYAAARVPDKVRVCAAHRAAYGIVDVSQDERRRSVFGEPDPVQRILMAEGQGFEPSEVARLVTSAVQGENKRGRRRALALALYLRYSQRGDLDPTAFELLAEEVRPVFDTRTRAFERLHRSISGTGVHKLLEVVRDGVVDGSLSLLEANFLLADCANIWAKESWEEALEYLKELLGLFDLDPFAWQNDDPKRRRQAHVLRVRALEAKRRGDVA